MVDHANSGLDHRVYEDESRSEFTGMKGIKEIKAKILIILFHPIYPCKRTLCGAQEIYLDDGLKDGSRSKFTGMKAIKEIKRKYLLFSFIPFIPINKLCGA